MKTLQDSHLQWLLTSVIAHMNLYISQVFIPGNRFPQLNA